jgi:NADH-quinone oxidoreductase subunit F
MTVPINPINFVDHLLEKHGSEQELLIPLLQAIQKEFRYLPEDALRRLCAKSEITASDIEGVASFYTQFRRKPVGEHIISMCHGTACHVKGSVLVHDAIRRHLKLEKEDEDTDASGTFTLQKVACLGCCTLAPVMQIDGVTYGHLTPENVSHAMNDFLSMEKSDGSVKAPDENDPTRFNATEIRISIDSCCIAGGSLKVMDALKEAIHDAHAPALIKPVGCVGMCHQIPMIEIVPPHAPGNDSSSIYTHVEPDQVEAIVRSHFRPKGIRSKLKSLYNRTLDNWMGGEEDNPVIRYSSDVREGPICDFLGGQLHIATEYSGQISPLDIDEYMNHEGFDALSKALNTLSPEKIIDIIQASSLRGRGGAGFPTGLKWRRVSEQKDPLKYLVMNGDEGDPGAFMDRMLLESYPFRVLEGILIAAYAVGAQEGVLYIRAEYPVAVQVMREAIRICEERNLLGRNIMGTPFSMDLRIMEGAGAFVCGEETALIASIEGKRGMPRIRPPYPSESGIHGHPTLINNVETYSLTPWIIRHGAKAFSDIGTQKSKGTKVFSLVGKVRRGGLIEVPMGSTIRDIVEKIGGGTPDGRFKAVQMGGPSGGCIPAELADTPVDYEELSSVGAIMGSGGMVVLDEHDCMPDIARYFLEFTQNESCGKCTFCRIGTRRMLEILERICAGHGKKDDLEKLEELAVQVKNASLCGLGQTAPNPVLSTLRYFREEYEEHLHGICRAGRCKSLIHYTITDSCIGCTRCAQICPTNAIPLTPYKKHTINDDLCTRCDTCRLVCPEDSIIVHS